MIILPDDQGYADVGVFGAKGFTTPNLDQMAHEGRRFTDFYVAKPVCSASRAALMTGCYPNRIGILGALKPKDTHGISDGEVTVAQLVKSKGYATGIFGKWHMGHHPQFIPTHHGFDEYFGLPYSNDLWPGNPDYPGQMPGGSRGRKDFANRHPFDSLPQDFAIDAFAIMEQVTWGRVPRKGLGNLLGGPF